MFGIVLHMFGSLLLHIFGFVYDFFVGPPLTSIPIGGVIFSITWGMGFWALPPHSNPAGGLW